MSRFCHKSHGRIPHKCGQVGFSRFLDGFRLRTPYSLSSISSDKLVLVLQVHAGYRAVHGHRAEEWLKYLFLCPLWCFHLLSIPLAGLCHLQPLPHLTLARVPLRGCERSMKVVGIESRVTLLLLGSLHHIDRIGYRLSSLRCTH